MQLYGVIMIPNNSTRIYRTIYNSFNNNILFARLWKNDRFQLFMGWFLLCFMLFFFYFFCRFRSYFGVLVSLFFGWNSARATTGGMGIFSYDLATGKWHSVIASWKFFFLLLFIVSGMNDQQPVGRRDIINGNNKDGIWNFMRRFSVCCKVCEYEIINGLTGPNESLWNMK